MPALGTYDALFEILTFGPHLPNSIVWRAADRSTEVTLTQANGVNLRLQVTLTGVSEPDGEVVAHRIARAFLDTLVVNLANCVVTAGPVRLCSHLFTETRGASRSRISSIEVTADTAVSLTLDQSAGEAALAEAASLPVRSPIAEAARAMLRAAVATADPTSRYLMLYSVLMFVAESTGRKRNPNKAANQGDVDALLLGESPVLPRHPDPRDANGTRQETELTRVRNEFIHAEGRSQNARKAMDDMKVHIWTLQTLTARIVGTVP